jgi:hypothetical protein
MQYPEYMTPEEIAEFQAEYNALLDSEEYQNA